MPRRGSTAKSSPKGPIPPHLLRNGGGRGGSITARGRGGSGINGRGRGGGGINGRGRGGGGGNASPFAHAHGYSLAEEARNTAHNRRGVFGRDAQLRYKPVDFVSAGFMDPLKLLEVTRPASAERQAFDIEHDIVAAAAPNGPTSPATDAIEGQRGPEPVNLLSKESASPPPATLPSTDEQPPSDEQHQEPESDLGWDSSEEIILFKGRDASRQPPKSTIPKPNDREGTAGSMEMHEINVQLKVVQETIRTESPRVQPMVNAPAADYIPLNSSSKRRQASRKPRHGRTPDADDEEAAMIADYIANMKNDEEQDEEDAGDGSAGIGSHAFHVLRDIGGTDSDAVPDQVTSEDGVSEGSDGEIDDDERLARMLAKQEELGLGGDDVLLLDGTDQDEGWTMAPKGTPRRKKKGGSMKDKMIQQRGQFPSATQMADAFDDLDLMDWHRPSLNNFKNGPKTFDVSDSELEEAMQMAWKKDRLKKAEKKKAREELRSQGLLGKNVNPDDLRVKYRGGMSLDDLANEMEVFLLGFQEQLILPPFDKTARKTVHSVANKFKIKSQSAGKGKDRYPILYRSKATLPFDQDVFDRTFARIKQTWFPRVDVDDEVVRQSRILKRAEVRDGQSRRGKNTLTLREGDVVGQHAAELGAENKGRAMLEKMGWSKGMALGTGENKGIIVPITHVVKKTKAGLGDA